MAAPVNRFKQSLKEGRQTIGCWLTQGTAIAAEIAATADFDWLLIDTEHSPNNLPSVLAQLQAIAGYDASAAVRPHVGETHVIKQILDMGCQTLIVPMVESGALSAGWHSRGWRGRRAGDRFFQPCRLFDNCRP